MNIKGLLVGIFKKLFVCSKVSIKAAANHPNFKAELLKDTSFSPFRLP